MGMKLISPFQNRDQQQSELTRKILRIQEIEDLATKTNAKMARAEADFNSMLSRNQEKWALEEQEHSKDVKERNKEVEILEKRKEQALIPIEIYKKQADTLIEEAQEIVIKAKEKEERADVLLEKLEEKLTEVADRETLIGKEEKRLKVAKQGIELQQQATREGVERLSKEMFLFHEKKEKDEASILERKKEVSMAEINLNAKANKYQRDLEALKIFERQLKDERETLDREYARRK